MKKLMAFILAVLSVALFSPADLQAQGGATGAITGTVLDQKGGAIAGATVVVTNVATGQKEREAVSTGAGTFNRGIGARRGLPLREIEVVSSVIIATLLCI